MFPVTFVILTDGRANGRILQTIGSLAVQSQPFESQIIIVGGETTPFGSHKIDLLHIPFDETQTTKPWLSRKKNIAAQHVKYDVTVWMHDYHEFEPDWYSAMFEFGLDWDIQMNQIRTIDDHRMFDWVVHDHPTLPRYFALPYERTDCVPYQYISGGYWVSKRHVMLEEPLNENLFHHDAEDLEWSRRVLPRYRYVMNPKAIVRHNKVHRECQYVKAREITHSIYTGWE